MTLLPRTRPVPHPPLSGRLLEEFFCGWLGGMAAFFQGAGWLLVYFGWLSISAALLLCGGIGLAFGCYLAAKSRLT